MDFTKTLPLIYLMCLINFVCTFNVDLKNPLIFRGTLDSHFGTATEMLESQGSKWLLVGAPRDNFTDIPDLVRPGNVYRCPIQAAGSNPRTNCQPIRIRSAENTNPSPVSGIYEQTEQNLGSSILVGSQAVVICAPLWKNLKDYPINRYYNPVGHCYELPHSDLTNVKSKFFRIGRNDWQTIDSNGATVQLYASALLGFSLATSPICASLWKNLKDYQSSRYYNPVGHCYELPNSDLTNVTSKFFRISRNEWLTFDNNSSATVHLYASALLGFSLATSPVCAPLWKDLRRYSSAQSYLAYGACHELDKSNLESVTPKYFDIDNADLFRFGTNFMATAIFGFSLARTNDSTYSVILGSPNTVNARGGFSLYKEEDDSTSFVDKLTVRDSPDTDNTMTSGSYMGYAVASGRFGNGLTPMPQVVVGSPGYTSSNGPVGAVTLLETFLSTISPRAQQRKQFVGREVGSGFGQSILVTDINGDSRDDVIVGAPLRTGDNGAYEVGAFYVYYGDGTAAYLVDSLTEFRGSTEAGSRFGQSLASLGDINADTFTDLAVGAPYEDSGRGAIYIFNGDEARLPSQYSQKIMAAAIDSGLRAFGFYLSKSTLDVDDNSYNDFAVGAYQSDHTVILRSRPIIVLTTRFTVPPNVPLNSTNQDCSTGNTSLPCVTLNLCFSFSGRGVNSGILIDYWIRADTLKTSKRQPSRVNLFLNGVDRTDVFNRTELSVSKTGETCEKIYARVNTLDRYFFQSIAEQLVFSINFELSNSSDSVTPVLANDIAKERTMTTKFDTGCATTCNSNLKIDMSMDNQDVILGETREIVARVTISNMGEPAYAASVIIEPSANTAFRGFDQDTSISNVRVSCSRLENRTTVQCDFQTPILINIRGTFSVRFDASRERILPQNSNSTVFSQNIQINATVRDNAEGSRDQDVSDNFASQSANIRLRSDVIISGISNPEQAKFTVSRNSYISFTQRYTVDNNGPSPSPGAMIYIDLPVRSTDEMKYLTTRNAIKIRTDSESDSCSVVSFPNRVKRETMPEVPETSKLTTDEKYQDVACSRITEKDEKYQLKYDCARIRCMVSFLEYKQFRNIEITLNLTESALPGIIQGSSFVRYFTEATVYPPVNLNIPYEQTRNTTAFASMDVFPIVVEAQTEPLNIWIIIGGSVGGLLFLIIIGIILWKCGFFKREKRDQLTDYKRKTMMQLRQSRMSMRSGRAAPPVDQERILNENEGE